MKTIGIAACMALMIAATVHGHHSFAAEFDGAKIQTIKGSLVEFQWMNPHAYLIVDVTDGAGKTVRWGVQSRNLSILKRQGLSKQTLQGRRGGHNRAVSPSRPDEERRVCALYPEGRR